jgi:glycosyltransferase involved in cell wall biosynthesis
MPDDAPRFGLKPRVTVCIPTYARTDWLPQAIGSVLGQTFRDFVLLIGDDATPGDAVRPVVEAYDDPRIRFVRFEENAGIVGNFNRLLGLSETEYVLQIGDDDVLESELLEATVDALDRNPRAGLAHTRFDLIDGEGRVVEHAIDWTGGLEEGVEPGATFLRESMKQSWSRVCASSALLRRAAVPAWGFRQEDFPPFDFGCWLEMARSSDFAFVARSLCRYRLHEHSFTAAHLQGLDNVRDMRRVKLAFLERNYPPGRERRALERLAQRSLQHELVVRVRLATLPERRLGPTLRGLARFARAEPGLLGEPAAWALLGGSIVGQRGVTALRRFLPARPP